MVMQAYSAQGLELEEKIEKGEWIALSFKKL